MTMISTHDTYKLSRINDIKFYSNTDNDLTVCIEDKLVMRAIQHQVFVLENKIVIYRGYIIKEDVTTPNSILIYKMERLKELRYTLTIDMERYYPSSKIIKKQMVEILKKELKCINRKV